MKGSEAFEDLGCCPEAARLPPPFGATEHVCIAMEQNDVNPDGDPAVRRRREQKVTTYGWTRKPATRTQWMPAVSFARWRREIATVMALAAIAMPSGTLAQDLSGRVAWAWDTFINDCGRAISDPNAFLQSHPPSNASAGIILDSSPDGQVVVATVQTAETYRQVQMLGTPGRLAIYCETYAGAFDPNVAHDGYGHLLGGAPNAPRLADHLRARLANLEGVTVAGGEVSEPAVHIYGAEVAVPGMPVMQDPKIDLLAITAPMAGRQAFIHAYADAFSLHLNGLYFIEAEGQ